MSSTARFLLAILIAGHATTTSAQSAAAASQPAVSQQQAIDAVPRVPGLSQIFDGINGGLTLSTVHSSANGWYSMLTPAVSYAFSPRYSADASASVYFHRLIDNQNPATSSSQRFLVDAASAGDSLIGFHATFEPRSLVDTLSGYVTVPTGDRSAGLGAGKVTFNATNHTEKYFRQIGLGLDLGAGNSSNVFNNLVSRNYSSVGGLAQFQTSVVVWLPRRSYFDCVAYEQLPFGSQTVYSGVGPPGSPSQTVVSTAAFAEDNGFTTFAGIPLIDHLTVSGYYNRSLRRQTDTVSVGITYVLRSTRNRKQLSIIDRAIREAEKEIH